MLLRLRLLLFTLGTGTLLLLLLCLGSQNLAERHRLQVGSFQSASLPSGFLVGVSLVIGVISGGSAVSVLMPQPSQN